MSGSFDSFEDPFADRGPVGFDEARLDDSDALADADPYLRYLAESGARVRRETAVGAEALAAMREPVAPRALVAAGTDARLLRAVLEPTCPVPVRRLAGSRAAGLGRSARRGGGPRR